MRHSRGHVAGCLLSMEGRWTLLSHSVVVLVWHGLLLTGRDVTQLNVWLVGVVLLMRGGVGLLAFLLVKLVLILLVLLALVRRRLRNSCRWLDEALQGTGLLLGDLLKVVLGDLLHLYLLLGCSHLGEELVERRLILLHVLGAQTGVGCRLLQVVDHHGFLFCLECWFFEVGLLVEHILADLLGFALIVEGVRFLNVLLSYGLQGALLFEQLKLIVHGGSLHLD